MTKYLNQFSIQSAGKCDAQRCWASISQNVSGNLSSDQLILNVVLRCTTDLLQFEIDDNLIQVKLHNGCQASRSKNDDKESRSYAFSLDNEIINEYNGNEVSKEKMTKLLLKNNDWIRFKFKVNMIGCK